MRYVMKKETFAKLALMGLSSGLLVASQLSAVSNPLDTSSSTTTDSGDSDNAEDGNMGYHVMTEDELMLQLSPEGIKMYQSMSPDGKALALLVASARCNGTNQCAGLNACQTADHDCAGKGSCKGKGKCALSDKNLAVKLVKDKMSGKRANMIQKR